MGPRPIERHNDLPWRLLFLLTVGRLQGSGSGTTELGTRCMTRKEEACPARCEKIHKTHGLWSGNQGRELRVMNKVVKSLLR